ncbi:hypothetical protein [Acinetobacter baumannii]|uniref:hypothetical protein n=1 Tax=Acinetobacter baumannii TaxID=470 RepID=UPI003FA4387E
MKFWNNTWFLWLLAFISMLGLFMMLILDGVWDWLMLLVTIVPIILGWYRYRVLANLQHPQIKKGSK